MLMYILKIFLECFKHCIIALIDNAIYHVWLRANKPDTPSSLGTRTPKSDTEKRLGNFLETNEPGIFQPQQSRRP